MAVCFRVAYFVALPSLLVGLAPPALGSGVVCAPSAEMQTLGSCNSVPVRDAVSTTSVEDGSTEIERVVRTVKLGDTNGLIVDQDGLTILHAKLPVSSPSTVLWDLALDIWASIGVELAIFFVTVLFAVTVRKSQIKSVAQKYRGAAVVGTYARTHHDVREPVAPTNRSGISRSAPPKQSTVTVRSLPRSRRVDCGGDSLLSISGDARKGACREPWSLVDEIVATSRSQPTIKSAHRSIEFYKELQRALRHEGTNMADITWYAKYSALDMYGCMVQNVIRTSQCHLVERLVEDMICYGVPRPLTFYESTMKQLAGQKHYGLALSVYDRLAEDGLQASAITCSCLVSFAAEVGDHERAVAFFDQLSELTTPSIRAYMTILRVHAKRQDWSGSLACIRKMQREGVPLDSLVLNVVLGTGVSCDKLEEVEELVDTCSQLDPPITDIVSYNILVKGYMQRSAFEAAMRLVLRMRQCGIEPNLITFNTMMDRASRSFQHEQVLDLLAMMRTCGLRPDKFTCSIMVKGLAKNPTRRQIDVCLDLLREAGPLCDHTLFLSLHGLVLDAAASAGDPRLLAEVQQLRARRNAFGNDPSEVALWDGHYSEEPMCVTDQSATSLGNTSH
eukprot:TRINITY_DN13250_c0_g2_i1.p1 TRINITY_DN13250_c0_g2~~TRINITY_DN13250_c0_g2_i1.p1  ORF type:complete len:618 (+),score=97.74 TRINITY_DN13250_c0_g2_i1:119-1972(+)